MRQLLIVSPVLALTLAACGGGAPVAQSTSVPAGSAATSAPTRAAATAAPTAVPTVEASEPVSFEDVGANLDKLDSYRMRFSADMKSADGKADGKMMFIQEIIKADDAKRFQMQIEGAAFGSGQTDGAIQMIEIVEIGEASYMLSGEGAAAQCVSFSSAEANPLDSFNPADLTGAIENATLVARGETVNGIKSDHYTFAENKLNTETKAKASGDLWVAQDGGYLVKYSGTAEGELGGTDGGNRTMVWTYDIEEINKLSALTVPKACADQVMATDIPLPDGITEKAAFGKMQTFKSSDDIATLVTFFEKELPAQGWKAGDKLDNGTNTQLTFTKDDRKLEITLAEDASSTSVIITEE